MLLEVEHATKKFGGHVAVRDVSFGLEEKSLLGLIGPNGAGKTTLLDVICGLQPCEGRIFFKSVKISSLKPNRIAKLGIGRTFQIQRVFQAMTVLENMLVPTISSRLEGEELRRKASDLLRLVGLEAHQDSLAGHLSVGQQKLLDLARVLMLDSELLLLDKPFSGVNVADPRQNGENDKAVE